ncbi:hypothetical protein NDU88_004508 [Pleurodeles waltl]|uniref:Uncharacterized protein n=1 Tax=Pleurodeles waltl TaxID=8319 RepID=A0AAV7SJ14_PLEWA|nr:hypothetical protein NDU88_004508 [Pleurodeles waltl]
MLTNTTQQADKCGAPAEERSSARTDLSLPASKELRSMLRQPCDRAAEPEHEDPLPGKGSTEDPDFRRSACKELKTEAHCRRERGFHPMSCIKMDKPGATATGVEEAMLGERKGSQDPSLVTTLAEHTQKFKDILNAVLDIKTTLEPKIDA